MQHPAESDPPDVPAPGALATNTPDRLDAASASHQKAVLRGTALTSHDQVAPRHADKALHDRPDNRHADKAQCNCSDNRHAGEAPHERSNNRHAGEALHERSDEGDGAFASTDRSDRRLDWVSDDQSDGRDADIASNVLPSQPEADVATQHPTGRDRLPRRETAGSDEVPCRNDHSASCTTGVGPPRRGCAHQEHDAQGARAHRLTPLALVLSLPVHAYRLFLSPWIGHGCRFQPTCSVYALEALRRHGGLWGGWLTLRRLARCHPFGGSGFDPVPPADRDA